MSFPKHNEKIFENSETGSQFTSEDVLNMIDSCLQVKKKLSNWESDFMESIAKQFEEKNYLSEKQIRVLERIYTETVK